MFMLIIFNTFLCHKVDLLFVLGWSGVGWLLKFAWLLLSLFSEFAKPGFKLLLNRGYFYRNWVCS